MGLESMGGNARYCFPVFFSHRLITTVQRSSLYVWIFAASCLLPHGSALSQERVPWTTSNLVGSPDPPKPFHIQRVYPRLQFNNPVELRVMTGDDRMLMMQVDGKMFVFDDDQNCEQAELILDLGKDLTRMRAFGFGLHPRFEQNRELFVVYSYDTQNVPDGARLSRFRVPREPPFQIDRESEEVLLTWTSGGHNGSTVHFDSEGLLYFSAGDGARPFPPDEFDVGQDLTDLRATICRIDVDQTSDGLPYRIPDDNPFVDHPDARAEIWAYGFRNPWRFTIDRPSGRLLCGDVGWEMWESVFDVKRGGNYGWSIFEGPGALRGDIKQGPTPIEKPLSAYTHSLGQSITGGIVYRGSDLPELDGTYLYGDYVSGLLWGLRQNGSEVVSNPIIAQTGIPIITFAHGGKGEALIVSYNGEIYQLVRNPLAGRPSRFPKKLSETGLFDSVADLAPAPGVYQYELAAVSHHPDASKQFHIAIPDDQTITVGKQKRQWKYPVGTVFARTFSRDAQHRPDSQPVKIETQLLHFDGLSWQPYSYLWDPSQQDATLLPAEGDQYALDLLGFGDETWPVHSRAQCRSCHTNQAGGAVGFSLENLSDRAIDRFAELGLINRKALPGWKLRKMVTPTDETADLNARARSYLAANCAHCHRRGGGGSVALDLEYSHTNDAINAIETAPMQGGFEIDDAKVIASGKPLQSVMLYRMATGGLGRMPKLAHHEPDPKGILLIHDWIRSMQTDQTKPSNDSGDGLVGTSAALGRLTRLLRSEQFEQAAAEARLARDGGRILIEGLFERFLPESERRRQLGPNINAGEILAMDASADRGGSWLTESRGAQCLACHRLDGRGQNVGPDLDGIGRKRTREELLESIIRPSDKIETKYQSRTVLTDDGNAITGLVVAEDDVTMTLRSADGKDHRVERDSIERQRVQPKSLMPSGQAETMTARELADLIAYLKSL